MFPILQVSRGFTRGTFEIKPYTVDKVGRNQHQVAISNARPKSTLVRVIKSKAR